MEEKWCRFIELTKSFDFETPKTHLMVHLNDRAKLHGNPWLYTTFLDESLNRELKKVLRLCHQRNFETMGLLKIVTVLENRAKSARHR